MSQTHQSAAPISTADGQSSAPPVDLTPQASNSSRSRASFDYPTQVPSASQNSTKVEISQPTEEPSSQSADQQKLISAAWQTDKKILGLWSDCSARNAWMYADGIGWRKFADNSDSAIVAFNIIAAHAKATGKGTNFYEGDDGKVNTLYVF